MKKISLFLLLSVLVLSASAQIKVKSQPTKLPTDQVAAVSKRVANFSILTIKPTDIKNSLRASRGTSRLVVEAGDSLKFDIALEENDIRSPNYRSFESSEKGRIEIPRGECSTYKGVVNGEPSSFARLLITDGTVEGLILDRKTGYYYLQPLSAFSKGADPEAYVLYNLADAKDIPGACGTESVAKILKEKQTKSGSSVEASRVPTTCRILEIATDSDYEFTVNNGGNPNSTILGILNTVDAVYQSDLNIKIVVVHQNFYSTSSDPYNSTDAFVQRTEFANNWNSNFTSVARDVAHLFTGKSMGGVLGIAYIGTVCSNPSEAYSITVDDVFEAYTTAHELGHNLGGTHPDPGSADCFPNRTVMCQGSNLATFNFSLASRNQINGYVGSNSTCILNFDNLEIVGPSIICANSSASFSIPNQYLPPISWSSSSNISLNTTSGNNVTGSTFNDAVSGWINASFTATTTPSCVVTNRKDIWLGKPDIYTIRYDSNIPTSTFNYVSAGVYHTAYANLYNTIMANLSGNINWNPSPSIGYSYDQYFHKYDFNLSPGDVLYFNPMSASNACGTTQRTLAFGTTSGFKLANNPVKDNVEIVFDNAKFLETLPDRVLLYDEKSTSPVREIQVEEVFRSGALRSNRLSIPVSGLQRGTYFLHVIPKEESREKVTRTRLLLE